jgi:hypothetical protein
MWVHNGKKIRIQEQSSGRDVLAQSCCLIMRDEGKMAHCSFFSQYTAGEKHREGNKRVITELVPHFFYKKVRWNVATSIISLLLLD